jgi:hypothetical protein
MPYKNHQQRKNKKIRKSSLKNAARNTGKETYQQHKEN